MTTLGCNFLKVFYLMRALYDVQCRL